jgi:3-oxoacyl-[acyl-carrier protein] reductase
MRLDGKTTIVTGAGSGFAAAIATAFATAGARVMVADADIEAAREVAGGFDGVAVQTDVSSDASVAALAKAATDGFGHIDILVNGAGSTHPPMPAEVVSEAMFDALMATSVKSLFLTTHYFVPAMKTGRAGVVLNIAASAATSPRPDLVWYSASKAWVVAATRAMALELAPFGIRVNAINPVAADAPRLPSFMGGKKSEAQTALLASIPMGRVANGDDVAAAALYLCSDAASLITGIALDLDGGRSL